MHLEVLGTVGRDIRQLPGLDALKTDEKGKQTHPDYFFPLMRTKKDLRKAMEIWCIHCNLTYSVWDDIPVALFNFLQSFQLLFFFLQPIQFLVYYS